MEVLHCTSPGWSRIELTDGSVYWYSVPARPAVWLPLAVVCARLLEHYDSAD
jgi:hypothetical protein